MRCQSIGRVVTSMTTEAWGITDFRCFTKLKCDGWVQGQVGDKHSPGLRWRYAQEKRNIRKSILWWTFGSPLKH